MAKKRLGKIARFKIQRRLGSELPGLGKPGALNAGPILREKTATNAINILILLFAWKKNKSFVCTMDCVKNNFAASSAILKKVRHITG